MVNYESGWTKKLYSISLEKKYKNPDLPMFDELAQVKACLVTCLNKLKEIEDFYDLSYEFEITTWDNSGDVPGKTIEATFTISVYEK